jgi:hypothetical protein
VPPRLRVRRCAQWNGHPSDDGHNHALGFVFEVLGLSDGLEWLAAPDGQPGYFTLTEWTGTRFFAETAYTDATLTESGGVLTYDDHVGPAFYQHRAVRRLRVLCGVPQAAHGRAVSPLCRGQRHVAWRSTTRKTGCTRRTSYEFPEVCLLDCVPAPRCVNCEPPPVGEPGTLALMGMVALGVVRRMRRRA